MSLCTLNKLGNMYGQLTHVEKVESQLTFSADATWLNFFSLVFYIH